MAKVLEPVFTKKFKKQFSALPHVMQTKFTEKLPIFVSNQTHPSFHAKKMSGLEYFEARLTYHYRFTYIISDYEIWFLTIGPHDTGLGKK